MLSPCQLAQTHLRVLISRSKSMWVPLSGVGFVKDHSYNCTVPGTRVLTAYERQPCIATVACSVASDRRMSRRVSIITPPLALTKQTKQRER